MKIFKILVIIVITVLLTLLACALFHAGRNSGDAARGEATIATLTHNQVKITEHFDAVDGLQGFVVQNVANPDQSGILYTTHSGKYLLSGAIVSDKGKNIVQDDFAKYIKPHSAEAIFKSIQKTAWIQDGKNSAPHKMYVVMDPNCRFCHDVYERTRALVNNGQLAIRWIIVGVIKPSSKDKAYAIFDANDPLKAIAQNEATFNTAQEEGGITPELNPSKLAQAKVAHNTEFMINNKLIVTPVIFYRNAQGQALMQQGYPGAKGALEALINKTGNQF